MELCEAKWSSKSIRAVRVNDNLKSHIQCVGELHSSCVSCGGESISQPGGINPIWSFASCWFIRLQQLRSDHINPHRSVVNLYLSVGVTHWCRLPSLNCSWTCWNFSKISCISTYLCVWSGILTYLCLNLFWQPLCCLLKQIKAWILLEAAFHCCFKSNHYRLISTGNMPNQTCSDFVNPPQSFSFKNTNSQLRFIFKIWLLRARNILWTHTNNKAAYHENECWEGFTPSKACDSWDKSKNINNSVSHNVQTCYFHLGNY